MNHEEREALLYAWGAAETGRYSAANDQDRGSATDPGDHPISRAREFAPGTRKRAALRLAGRDGQARRRLMGKGVGMEGLHTVPKWAADPIRCTETRSAGPRASYDAGIPPHLQPIAAAARELYRENELRGLVLRIQYCWFGTQAEKAERVEQSIKEPVSVDRYKRELRAAREWIDLRLKMAA